MLSALGLHQNLLVLHMSLGVPHHTICQMLAKSRLLARVVARSAFLLHKLYGK